MKAMLLAAGRGERMRPLTDTRPKPLLEAGGKALIVHHIERLADAGFRELVINHAWLGATIEAALGDGARFGVTIRYSAEGVALETAGGIAKALPLLRGAGTDPDGNTDGDSDSGADAPFLVVSADTYTDYAFVRAHEIARQMNAHALTLHCVMVPNPPHHGHGDFLLEDGLLGLRDAAGARSSPSASPGLTYAGIGLFRPSLFSPIVPGTRCALRPVLEAEIAARRAGGEYHAGRWFDIGTPERLTDLDRLISPA